MDRAHPKDNDDTSPADRRKNAIGRVFGSADGRHSKHSLSAHPSADT